jgi:hypothetical protein
MAGGIAILLIVIMLVVAAVVGLVLYLTGGALWARKTNPDEDLIDHGERAADHPRIERVRDPQLDESTRRAHERGRGGSA